MCNHTKLKEYLPAFKPYDRLFYIANSYDGLFLSLITSSLKEFLLIEKRRATVSAWDK